MLNRDIEFMRLAVREARKGDGRTSPNPCVGAVVVKNNKVIAKGYHRKAGTPHAEIHALQAAGRSSRGATLYVTLEPCNHAGRTPPCTEAVINSGIRRVVVGMRDPNAQVKGGGCQALTDQGLEVRSGILEEECRELNLPFIKHCDTGMPWVILKAGMSLDGKIAAARGVQTPITNELSLQEVHRIRNRVDAILVGIETVLVDDPSLTARLPGNRSGRDPLRIILDSRLRLPVTAKILTRKSSAQTWIFCNPKAGKGKQQQLEQAGAIVKRVPMLRNGRLDLRAVLGELGHNQVQSLLVEGGGRVHGSFLAAGLVDQVILFVAPVFIGDQGVPVVQYPHDHYGEILSRMTVIRTRRFADNIMVSGRFAGQKKYSSIIKNSD